MLMTLVKWASLPLLLIGSIFSGFAAEYELPLDFAICLGALVVVERAVSASADLWATWVLLLIACTGIAARATLYTASKRQPVRAV
jgi:hypothetical protein